ncbi:uncharacterized protein LAESUDRAFT_723918, partial [Laetiporus sulphureus 93-53]
MAQDTLRSTARTCSWTGPHGPSLTPLFTQDAPHRTEAPHPGISAAIGGRKAALSPRPRAHGNTRFAWPD